MSDPPVIPVASQASVSSSHIAAIYAITDDNPHTQSGRVSPAISIISASSVASHRSQKFAKKDKNSQVIPASSRIHSPIDESYSPKRKTPSITDHTHTDEEERGTTPTLRNPVFTPLSTQSDIPNTQTTEDINLGDIGINIQHTIDNTIKDINNALNPKPPRKSIIDNTDDLLNAILVPIFQNINNYPTFTDALRDAKLQLAHKFSQAFEEISNKFGSLAYSLEDYGQPEVTDHMDEDEGPIATNAHPTWGRDITAELTWDSNPTPTQPPYQPSAPPNEFTEVLKTIMQQIHSLQAEIKEVKQKVFSESQPPAVQLTPPPPPDTPTPAPKAISSASVHAPAPSQAPSASAAPNIRDFPALPPPNSNKPKPTSYASAAQAPKAPTPKVPAKAIPSVSKETIQSAIKRDLADKSKRLCVRFESMPLTQPSPERIAIAMTTVLKDHQITLGGSGSYLLKLNWTSKGALSLTFSPQMCIPAAKRAIELLVAHLHLPRHEASTEEGWSRLAIVGLPTGINSEICQVYNASELSNIIDASPLKDLGLTKDKYTLEPNWIADPKRIESEQIPISTVSFAFKDPGHIITQNILKKPNQWILARRITIKEFVPKQSIKICTNCARYGHLPKDCRSRSRCNRCGSDKHNTDEHVSTKCKGCTKIGDNVPGKMCRCVWCPSCSKEGHLFGKEDCPKTKEFRRNITDILNSSSKQNV